MEGPGDDVKKQLLALYRTPNEPGSFRGIKGLQAIAKANKLGRLTVDQARKILQDDNAYTLHGRVVKGAANLNEWILTSSPFDLWEADLLDAPHTRQQLRRERYLLCVIDVYTKYAMVRVIERKDKVTVANALKDILKENLPPNIRLNALRTDAGTEFFNRYNAKEVMGLFGINHYRAQKEPGASVIERFNRTLANAMTKYITSRPTATQAELLACVPDFVHAYNNTVHSAIRQTPQSLHDHAYSKGSKSGVDILKDIAADREQKTPEEKEGDAKQGLAGLYQATSMGRNKKPNPWDPVQGERPDMPLPVGQPVRVLLRGDILRKGSRQKSFSDEVFTVSRVSKHSPNAYYLKDENGEELVGKFYRRQLQALTSQPDRYEVRVLRRRRSRRAGTRGRTWRFH